MKKLTLTIAIILGLSVGATAQPSGGGLFQRGDMTESNWGRSNGGAQPMLPPQHGLGNDQDADGPLEGGAALLFGLAVIYFTRKKDHHD